MCSGNSPPGLDFTKRNNFGAQFSATGISLNPTYEVAIGKSESKTVCQTAVAGICFGETRVNKGAPMLTGIGCHRARAGK